MRFRATIYIVLPFKDERSYSATVHPFFLEVLAAERVTSGVTEDAVESLSSGVSAPLNTTRTIPPFSTGIIVL